MNLTPEETKISEDAFTWVKGHEKFITQTFANENEYTVDELPTTIFMAGCPGAGKTEVSRRLAEQFKERPVIIDADEVRKIIPGYEGRNAYLFQRAATRGVNILYNYACHKGLNIILDGTFAYANVVDNIEQSLKHQRNIEIYFLYQDPILSWNFTKERELKEFRNVPKDVFINAYLKSMENVVIVKNKFNTKIKLNIIVKDFSKGISSLELNKDSLENFLPKVYTYEELEGLLQ